MASAALELLIQLKDEASAGLSALTGGLGGLGTVALGGAAVAAGAVAGIGVAALSASSEVNQAVNDLQAGLGLTAAEAENLAGVAQDVWANNWGNSISDVNASLTTVVQNMGAVGVTSNEAIGQATAAALALRDTFGIDVAESTDAAATLMQQFGLSSQQAFDFIAKGTQEGLNRSGDFLDTIGEYSTQFAAGGATAEQFFSLLDSGLQGGVLGTDKAADAFKEFRVRIQDGSTATSAGLAQLGIDADLLAQQMASGQVTAADAFQLVLGKLNETDDANIRMQAGVALLGTQFEDLGTQGALALSMTGTSLNDLAGATDSLNAKYANWGSLWEGVKRQALDAIMPLSAGLLDMANSTMPAVQSALSGITSTIADWVRSFQEGGFSGLVNNIVYSFSTLGPMILTELGTLGAAILTWITTQGPIFVTQMAEWGAAFVGWIATVIPQIVSGLLELASAIGGWIAQQAPGFAAQLGAWAVAFVGWLPGAISQLLGALAGLAGSIIGWIVENGPGILGTLAQWGIGFGTWVVTTAIPTLLSALGELATNFGNWITENGPTILAKLSEWGSRFGTWVTETGLPALLTELASLRDSFSGWITENGPTILAKLSEWGNRFGTWVTETALPALLTELGNLWDKFSGWIVETTPKVAAKVKEWATAFLGWVATDVLPKIAGVLDDILTRIGSWVDTAVKGVGDEAAKIGKGVVDGIKQGLSDGWGKVTAWLEEKVASIPEPIRKIMGIASPSKVMAAEVGAPIVDGIVAGLVQRSPKAVQAMLDLASSMFDVVNKGVEAFGKLTQLGTIPQSAIANFGDAIMRTLTDFSERVGQWDRAAMSAASQFVFKAGQVVEFLTKGVELLNGIASMAVPSEGAIRAFADSLAMVMSEIVRVSTFGLRLGLTAGVEFASGAKAIAEMIGAGVDALNKLSDFVRPAPGVIQEFAIVVWWLVDRFVEVGGWMNAQALGAAQAFAAAAGQVFAVVAAGVDALLKLGEFVKPAPGVIQSFAITIWWLVAKFAEVGSWMSGPALAAATDFAEAAGKVVGVIAAGVDGMLKLAEFVRPAPGLIDTFTGVVWWLVSRFAEVAGWMSGKAIAAASAFAESAGKVLSILKNGVDGLNALAGFTAPGYEAMVAFSNGVDAIVWLMYMVAEDVSQKATDAAAKFAEGAGKVLAILKSGAEGLAALRDFVMPSYEAMIAFGNGVDAIVWLMYMVADDVGTKATDAAAKFSEGAGKVLTILKNGADGLTALRDFTIPSYEAMIAFGNGVDAIVWLMYMVAEDVGAKATEAAALFATGAGKALGILKSGADGLAALVDFAAPAESGVRAFFGALANLITLMAVEATKFDADMLAVTGAFAAGVQKSVAGIGAAADALGKLVEFEAPAGKHISAFFGALANLLTQMKQQAAAFDVSLFETTTAFAAGVNSSIAPLKGAIESLGKFVDFVPPAQKGVSAFFQSVGALLTTMGQLAGQYSAEFFAGTILFGQNVAKSVATVKAAFDEFASLADLKGLAAGVLTKFTTSLAALLDELAAQMVPAAENIGAMLVYGIADGISAQLPYLVATLQNAAYTMISTVQSALGIASPSKVFEQLGQYVGEGMAGGMESMQPAIAGAGAGLGMAAVGGASGATRGGGGGGEGLTINIGSGAIVLNGVQGGVGEKELRRLAQMIKEEIANERGSR